MATIYRQEVPVGEEFFAPAAVTFGWQEARQAFSVWFNSDDKAETQYIVLGTGAGYRGIAIVATVIMPDGFHAFHLCRIEK